MHTSTTLLTTAGLLFTASVSTLAQTTDPNVDNTETPFVRNSRPDRPGQTITTNMLHPGQVQLETGLLRFDPTEASWGARRTLSSSLLRIGFFNHIELRATQSYLHPLPGAVRMGEANPAPTPAGFTPLTVGAKFLASTNQDARSQVVLLTEMTLRTGDASFLNKTYEPAVRLLVSQQLGPRYGLEANVGFRQRGFKAADTKQGQYLGTLALNGPLGGNFGFFAEAYTTWQRNAHFLPGLTGALYWRPLPGLRLDVSAGQQIGNLGVGFTLGGGLSIRLPK